MAQPSIVGANFLVPNLTFVVELAAFLLVLFFLRRYVLPPLSKAIDDRQETIRQSLADAETAKRRAEEAEADYRTTIDQARQEARTMVDEANKLGEQLKVELRQRGEQEYERIVARAQSDIDAATRRAAEELRRNLAETVIAVVHRVVGDALDAEGHRQLIDRTIAEVENEAGAETEVKA